MIYSQRIFLPLQLSFTSPIRFVHVAPGSCFLSELFWLVSTSLWAARWSETFRVFQAGFGFQQSTQSGTSSWIESRDKQCSRIADSWPQMLFALFSCTDMQWKAERLFLFSKEWFWLLPFLSCSVSWSCARRTAACALSPDPAVWLLFITSSASNAELYHSLFFFPGQVWNVKYTSDHNSI